MERPEFTASNSSRRNFLRTSTLLTLGGALSIPRNVYAAGSETLRIGLIGCGGRGSGAAVQALQADPDVKLVALGDTFADRIHDSLIAIRRDAGDNAHKIDVPEDRCFVGFDAYQKVIDSGVDVVLLAAPPHFRPMHLRAAIDAGKHVFAEKPVAVDAPGVRSVLATAAEAARKGRSIVSGLCWRYDAGVRETIQRVMDGQIGELRAIQATYNASPVTWHGAKPGWSEMEHQIRDWYYFVWLSGDFNVEQHVHTLDKAAWALGEQPPIRATGLGGRQVRDEKQGDVYDHFAVCYEYPNDLRLFSYCRQMVGCSNDNDAYFIGTNGQAMALKHVITGDRPWRYKGPKPNMYQVEHDELFASIRSGKPINNGHYMANSTMMAILGRMATYTGRTITWEQALSSEQNLSLEKYEWGPAPPAIVAMPGVTKFT